MTAHCNTVDLLQALKMKVHMVYELLEENGEEPNCPICLETIAPGEQVQTSLRVAKTTMVEFWCGKVVEPGCAASLLHSGHAHCFKDWLAR